MICLDGESGKGSCRSTGSFNLFEALSACSDCLEGFGGHAMAAGVTVRRGAWTSRAPGCVSITSPIPTGRSRRWRRIFSSIRRSF